ncbi:hypothetical protein KQI84_00070 [bacterium]|nr:hypothetical protein [bacterium]
MIYHLLIAVGTIVGLSLLWLGVMTVLRKQNPELPAGADIIGDRSHCHENNCEGCALSSSHCDHAGDQRRHAEGSMT